MTYRPAAAPGWPPFHESQLSRSGHPKTHHPMWMNPAMTRVRGIRDADPPHQIDPTHVAGYFDAADEAAVHSAEDKAIALGHTPDPIIVRFITAAGASYDMAVSGPSCSATCPTCRAEVEGVAQNYEEPSVEECVIRQAAILRSIGELLKRPVPDLSDAARRVADLLLEVPGKAEVRHGGIFQK